ncbi:DUF2071 domain-containing protein [Flammeovirga kamogawensis]|uniref:DUF2071 domain-containing protein n=1 Tax=Flammeovirga kamogawensis TaxID=373891 RepID=A0ABX8H3H8_9BACT|nr:DUF2071 domain-containing protein [Flammeovirga kamogawensis]MBB6461937.1 hypothetical protein [Flammeovirga kamogawensis]QWG10456.1 DUF2071 domain-containing protein [Flammeovirga kamogawensis]TRX63567.1 hypothetical protein EO216_24405 [Flammeovirga kamogawensis]
MPNYREILDKRVQARKSKSKLDVNTLLEHFAIISYKVPLSKIEKYIPKPFKLWTFLENGVAYALVSAVPFKDKDFRFYKLHSSLTFNFYQTNFRTYIIDERDGSYAAWFFGTTLGSITHIFPKLLWKMPWEFGRYSFDFIYEEGRYKKYVMEFTSKMGNGKIDLEGTTEENILLNGFSNLAEQDLILTHPVKGYYTQSESKIGTYEIWHPKFNLKQGKVKAAYFELFERLELLSKEDMKTPHSVLITDQIVFDVLLPPANFNNPSE